MASPFSWPVLVPSALRATAPVNQGVRPFMQVKQMKFAYVVAFALGLGVCHAHAQSRIVCDPTSKDDNQIASIWPAPYLSDKGSLCFDVKGWPEYSGQNCVQNGGRIAWTGLVIVTIDGESQGRDSTSFRVVKPVLNADLIEYTIEWSRDTKWAPMQRVKINRLSGEAVSYFITMHGGESYQCHLEKRRL